ncbi:mannose-6-phosphate isomerase, class I [Psychromonas ossibalaenae]|uniref:mannose-6-phosphate isomerase, class I n=1 Tax=Psychromonas ossibalaenae TaxID=444922 RepID=UPI00035FC9B4|nr:mannose-6-phosphate isomerase, class I [Psychromonas ossibalaenae]
MIYLPFYKMTNTIQNYEWGSKTAMQGLFAFKNKTQQTQAELWMGAHANGCSLLSTGEGVIKLSDFIAQDPHLILGKKTADEFGQLPYLFKVLAAEKALSVQVHPNKQQAQAGFAKENKLAVPHNAFNRNYKDANHKPEVVFALTEYLAMNGFRDMQQIVEYFQPINILEIKPLLQAFSADFTAGGLQDFFQAMLLLEGGRKTRAVQALMVYAQDNLHQPLFSLIAELGRQYPGDIGLFSPLMMNVLTLQPGEAMFLDACTPHAYIKGTGLEIMANSDNVLRAGLTPKYIDVPELLANTIFCSKAAEDLLLKPQADAGWQNYVVPVSDFKLSIADNVEDLCVKVNSAEIIFAVDAPVRLSHRDENTITINKGESLFIPAYAGDYQVSSSGQLARAYN